MYGSIISFACSGVFFLKITSVENFPQWLKISFFPMRGGGRFTNPLLIEEVYTPSIQKIHYYFTIVIINNSFEFENDWL